MVPWGQEAHFVIKVAQPRVSCLQPLNQQLSIPSTPPPHRPTSPPLLQKMLFKTSFTAALFVCLSLAAGTQAGPAEDLVAGTKVTDLINGVAWPVAFTEQCEEMLAIVDLLAKDIARANAAGHFCTDEQRAIVDLAPITCDLLYTATSAVWPIAFANQNKFIRAIHAQAECLSAWGADPDPAPAA
ncbi:MAG: hypothetical protein J3R72DRAFT_60347 [Linnemannia gamsii]|nr:MAG: hypothetical protein J3R72DRAFT_60347 [Linnemannia gamsii]